MEPGPPLPPGDGGLRQGGNTHAAGDVDTLVQTGQQVLAGGDGFPTAGKRGMTRGQVQGCAKNLLTTL